jgi:Na+-transporting methylmalonyl-CoA/oxaloacetate decarboxylase gamma subunit
LNEINQGLILSGIGILITFSALGILILVIQLLKTLFPPEGRVRESVPIGEGPGKSQTDQERKKRIAAGVGAALILQENKYLSAGLGKVLETPPGSWWHKALDRIQFKE